MISQQPQIMTIKIKSKANKYWHAAPEIIAVSKSIQDCQPNHEIIFLFLVIK